MSIIPYYVSKKEKKPFKRIAIVIITIVVLIILGTIIYLKNTDDISISKYFLQSNDYGKEQGVNETIIKHGNNISDEVSNTKVNSRNETSSEDEINNNKEEISTDRKIDPNKPMIALTFDDGPGDYTEKILNVLKDNKSVATFYVLGNRVESYSEIVRQIVEEGNEIGNHTYSHKELTTISKKELTKQIDETQEAVFTISGVYPKTVRPTYGAVNNYLRDNIKFPLVNWNIDTLDWQNKNPKKIVDEIVSKATDGDIVLMHDIYSTTADAVEIVIPKLIDKGFQLVTVSELYKYKEVNLEKGKVYFGMD